MKLKHEYGQGLVEYALILVLVAISVITILEFIGPVVSAAMLGDQMAILWLVIGTAVVILILAAAFYVLTKFEKFSIPEEPEKGADDGNKTEKGQGLIEYSLIIVLWAIVFLCTFNLLAPYLITISIFWQIVINLAGSAIITASVLWFVMGLAITNPKP